MFGKHYEDMYSGSMRGSGAISFAVWGYVISHQKPPDFDLELNPEIIGFLLGEKAEDVEAVIERFCQPDPKSRHEEEGGRRLLKLNSYMYHVVNGKAYHDLRSAEERKAYWRAYKQKKRNGAKPETAAAPEPKPDKWHKDTRTVLHLLNEATGRHFRETEDNCGTISARLNESGVDLEGVKQMIARQCQRWKGDPKMNEYLQPSTLFGKSKFDNYYSARDLPVAQELGPGGYGDSGGVEQGEAYNERLRKAGRLIEGGAGPAAKPAEVVTDTPPEPTPERKNPYERSPGI